jgi:site-specific DNA-methyltransferase (adenine-specific)
MEINKIYNINFLENTLPDKCAKLIIADPPYFEIKGAFDFIWSDLKAYLLDVEKWAIECKRLLADNGTLFWYGHAKNIAYSQVILDEHFELINNLVWEKTDCQTKKSIEYFRMFAPITERILMYSNDNDLSFIMNDQTLFKSIRDYFLEEKAKCNLSFKQINETCFNSASNGGGMASNILTSDKDGWSFPTQEKYEALQKIGICEKPYIDLKMEYDYLKTEYESLRRPFQNSKKLF